MTEVTFKKVQNASITFGDRSSIGHQPGHYAVLVDGERVGLIVGEHQGYMEIPRWNYWADNEDAGHLVFDAVRPGGVVEPVRCKHKIFRSLRAAKAFIVSNIEA